MDMIARAGPSRRLWALALIIATILLLVATRGGAADSAGFIASENPAERGLSMMTYNVEGLPWPVRFGRAEALGRIGDRLGAMRAAGRQPRIVLLQEAFSEDAQAIPTTAGYRYAAFGPGSDDAGAPALLPADRAFRDDGSFLKGERSGKLLDSGLIILSDYPIRAVRSMPFPDHACAGYDCLANKGMLMVVVGLPDGGSLAIVNLHLNSRKASGVSRERADAAFRRQTDAVAAFLAANRRAGVPTIVGGDFNIGKSAARRAMVIAALGGALPRDVLSASETALPADAAFTRRRAKDWQFLLPGAADAMRVRRIAAPFGREPDGTMLSDHVGYTAYLETAPRMAAAQVSPRG